MLFGCEEAGLPCRNKYLSEDKEVHSKLAHQMHLFSSDNHILKLVVLKVIENQIKDIENEIQNMENGKKNSSEKTRNFLDCFDSIYKSTKDIFDEGVNGSFKFCAKFQGRFYAYIFHKFKGFMERGNKCRIKIVSLKMYLRENLNYLRYLQKETF